MHKITIIPEVTLGVTVLLPTEDRLSMSKEYAQRMIAYAMGGRAAEEGIIQGHFTTGAGDDTTKATEIARKMVCSWGMSDKLGPIALAGGDHEVFLGREFGHQESYSEQVLNDIDSEVKRFITEGYEFAIKVQREPGHSERDVRVVI